MNEEKVRKSLVRLVNEAGFDVNATGASIKILTMLLRDRKVLYKPDGKVYDFGYVGGTGKAIIYNQGERNGQDSYAVDLENLEIVKNGR